MNWCCRNVTKGCPSPTSLPSTSCFLQGWTQAKARWGWYQPRFLTEVLKDGGSYNSKYVASLFDGVSGGLRWGNEIQEKVLILDPTVCTCEERRAETDARILTPLKPFSMSDFLPRAKYSQCPSQLPRQRKNYLDFFNHSRLPENPNSGREILPCKAGMKHLGSKKIRRTERSMLGVFLFANLMLPDEKSSR